MMMFRPLAAVMLMLVAPVQATASDTRPLLERLEAAIVEAGLAGSPAMSPHRPAPDCDLPPKIEVDREALSVTVSCQEPRWRRIFRIISEKTAPRPVTLPQTVLTLVESLPAGTILQSAHIAETDVPPTAATTALVLRDHAVGRRLKTALGAGRVLQARHLEMSYTLQKGDLVTVTLDMQGIKVAAEAIALENAQLGERVELQSVSSDKILTGIVTGTGKVSVVAKTF